MVKLNGSNVRIITAIFRVSEYLGILLHCYYFIGLVFDTFRVPFFVIFFLFFVFFAEYITTFNDCKWQIEKYPQR